MRKLLLSAAMGTAVLGLNAQVQFDPTVDANFISDVVVMPKSPLTMQPIFIGGVDKVKTTATYGNAAGEQTAKQWHDFIGITPDPSGESIGWVSVNHEMILKDDKIGDGGGMTVFRVKKEADTLVVMDQTLTDGRSGKYFNVDFVNTVGPTGMNCGGIISLVDGRIWTAEEWFRSSNASLDDRDLDQFVIGTGTPTNPAPAGFPGFNGDTLEKYENYNWMVEIDPKEAVAIRKQYNWGRQGFEGGTVMLDNKTVYVGSDATPGFLTKFVATTAGDFTDGKTYVYKHDAPSKWAEIDNSDLSKMLNFADEAVAAGATMFNRIEWISGDAKTGKVYFTATGRDNPGGRWRDENVAGAVHNPNTMARANAQGTHPDSSDYEDYYGRIWVLDPATDEIEVHLEGGPDFSSSPTISNYPDVHLSNPDGINVAELNGNSYLLICEDLNGTSNGRVPAGITNRACELYILDLSIANPSLSDLQRITVAPFGAEITGAVGMPDGKSILVNSQHPSSDNPYPYNNSMTIAIHGFDQAPSSLFGKVDLEEEGFDVFPNPATREVRLNKVTDVAVYDMTGKRIKVYRDVNKIDVMDYAPGAYFLKNAEGESKKLIIE
jgi:secreted PhoX family phosphatase